MTGAPWPDPHIERLTALWTEGLSCSQIANTINREFRDARYSRSAVIGKVHRLGLSGRATPSTPRQAAVKRSDASRLDAAAREPRAPSVRRGPDNPLGNRKAKAPPRAFSNPIQTRVFGSPTAYTPNAADAPFTPAAPIIFDATCACRLEDLTPTRCKWPIGDPASPTFVFCGRPKPAEGGPYCEAHAKIAFKPAEKKKTGSELVRSLRRWLAA